MCMRKTKIIATLGPATFNKNKIKQLISSGVNVFRINMSHVHDSNYLKDMVQVIRSTSEKLNKQTGILMDKSAIDIVEI